MFRFDKDVRTELQSNWPALLVAFSCLLFGFSAPAFALPFLFSEVISEFGWTREQATLLASAKYLTGAVAALMVGRFIDTTGVRNALLLTIGIGGVAMVSFLWTPNLTFYYLSGILLGFSGPGAMVAVKVLVSRTFHASQGTAMGVALLGTSLGAVVVPLIISALIGHFGWRVGMASMSLGIWFVAIPMLFIGLFNQSMASPDAFAKGSKATPAQILARKQERQNARAAGRAALRILVRNRSFWLIAGAVFAVAIVDQAFIQHQVLILDDMKVSREVAAWAISAIGLVGIGFRVVVGNILDSTSHKGAAVLYLLLTLSSLLAFLLGNPIVLFVYVVTRAAGHAAVLLDTTVLTKHAFGLKNYGTLVGIYTAIVSLGYATGPWLMGRMYDMDGSYRSAFILFAAIPVLAGVLIWFMKPDYWSAPKGKSAAASEFGVA